MTTAWLKADKSNGQGTYTYADGGKFVGEFKDGKSNGNGERTFSSGDKYVGEEKEGKKHGQGTYFRKDGKIGHGEWFEDKPSGRFIEYRADKTVERSGIYKDGMLVTSQYIDPNSFTRIAKNNSAPAVSDSQRQAIEQRERQVAIEAERLAEQKRIFDAEKAQREQEKKASRIVITASATQPDSSGVVTINIQTNTDTSSLKINGEELGGKPDGSYSVKRVARVGQETKFIFAATDVYGNTDSKTITVIPSPPHYDRPLVLNMRLLVWIDLMAAAYLTPAQPSHLTWTRK